MSGYEYPLGVILTVLAGVALAVQGGVNATLGAHVTRPFAGVVSFTMGAAVCCIYLLIDATAVSKQLPSVADLRGTPWWAFIGGALGAYYVIVQISFSFRLGAGTATALFVCAQLVTSVILDVTGLVGFTKRVFSWPRICGATLMIMGVVLVTQFPGEPATNGAPKPPSQQQQPQQQQQQQHVVSDPPAAAAKGVVSGLRSASAPAALLAADRAARASSSSSGGANGDTSGGSSPMQPADTARGAYHAGLPAPQQEAAHAAGGGRRALAGVELLPRQRHRQHVEASDVSVQIS